MAIIQQYQTFLLAFFLQTFCFGLIAAFVFGSAQADVSLKILGSLCVSTILFLVHNVRYIRMRQKLEKTGRSKTDSLIHLCHALRSPLTTIYGISEIFKERQGNLDSGQKELIRRLSSSTIALKTLITTGLDFSDTENTHPHSERVSGHAHIA